MARGGFLGRIGRAIRNIIAPPPRPSPPREPPPQEPPEPPRRGDPYREIWRDEKRGRRGDYRKNRALFSKLMDDLHEEDEDEREMLWRSYVRNIVNTGGRYRRQDINNPFWRDVGVDPVDFDWAKWRIAMGYTGRRRSRTP